jgi:hypothetical protein
MLGIIIALIMILTPLSIYFIEFNNIDDHEIVSIDGNFSDWNDIMTYRDNDKDTTKNPNVNIIEFGVTTENNRILSYLEVEEELFAGTNNEFIDSIRIFYDTDNNIHTGYSIRSIGADYMIEVHGVNGRMINQKLSIFNSKETHNWNGWNPYSLCEISHNKNTMELSFVIPNNVICENTKNVQAIFVIMDNNGNTDHSDYKITSGRNGAIELFQKSVAKEVITPSEDEVLISEIEVIAHGTDLKIEPDFIERNLKDTKAQYELRFTNIPRELKMEQRYNSKVYLKSKSTTPGELVNIDISKLDSKGLFDQNSMLPITTYGEPLCSYYSTAPDRIVIDGAFGDWCDVSPNLDLSDEVTIKSNQNIDLKDFREVSDESKLSFYLQVDGTMMKGSEILEKPLVIDKGQVVNNDDQFEIDLKSSNENKKPLEGLDAAYIFIDTDKNSGQRINEYRSINKNYMANYMIELNGHNGEIIEKSFYEYSKALDEWEMKQEINLKAATDATRLEAQVEIQELLDILGISRLELKNANFYYKMTDWSENYDISVEIPYYKSNVLPPNNFESELENPSLTRGPPGGWGQVEWRSSPLVTDTGDDVSQPYSDIYNIYVNDTDYILAISIFFEGSELDQWELFGKKGMSWDFYFNVSESGGSSTWYKISLYNSSASWTLYLNWTTVSVSTVPDDNASWTNEWNIQNIKPSNSEDWEDDMASMGVAFEGPSDNIRFWVNKTNLSKGYTLLTYGHKSAMYGDSHYYNNTWYADRVPDSSVQLYNPWSNSTGIPEFEQGLIMIPILISFMVMMALGNRVKRRKKCVSEEDMTWGES